MRVRVNLPAQYQLFKGIRLKRYAWAYLKKEYPYYIPDKEQPFLESDNILLCTIDFDLAREQTKKVNERREELKKRKRKK